MVLVDNCITAFASQLGNGIPIISYYDEEDDDELLNLKNYLLDLFDKDDVRPIIKNNFRNHLYDQCGDVLKLIGE